jgi:hypothetical protein
MENLTDQSTPDASVEERAVNDMIKRIRKLRWIGLDGEAQGVARQMRGVQLADSVLAAPSDTD